MRDGKHVILCVDDDPDILDALKAVLESKNYVAESAPTAEAGLKKYDEVEPDLLIVDLMMEEVDAGTEFVKELKARGNTAPVFLLSSAGDGLTQSIDTSALGLAGVFQKPVDPKTLLATVESHLG